MKSPASIELVGVSKSFGSLAAVKGLSLTVQPGEIRGLLGKALGVISKQYIL